MRRTPHPRGGDFAHPLNISDILSVCHDRQDLLPGILARLRERHRYGDLPPWSYIRLRDSNLKFYIEGRFVGRYDRRRQLRRKFNPNHFYLTAEGIVLFYPVYTLSPSSIIPTIVLPYGDSLLRPGMKKPSAV